MEEQRLVGSVKWFNTHLGYGFLVVEGHKTDIFIHRQQMVRSGVPELSEGDKVSFTLQTGKKGDYATKITRET
jgi:CspA family cold shock protein